MQWKYRQAILGGTFDHLHVGHEQLLDAAFAASEHVDIGLATEQLYRKKFLADAIESYADREAYLTAFLHQRNYTERATIIPLHDFYGTSLRDQSIEALFVTEVTQKNAKIINTEREKKGFAPLEINVVPLVVGNDGEVITSERLRYGVIDRQGRAYRQLFRKTLILPEALREELKHPIGAVARTLSEIRDLLPQRRIISVGDIISTSLQDAGYRPAIHIIDLKTRRHGLEKLPDLQKNNTHILRAANEHGTIQTEAVKTYEEALQCFIADGEPQIVLIDGEEDLLALPAILLAPLGSVVLYGQYDKGIVVNEVTEEMKKKVENLVLQFVS